MKGLSPAQALHNGLTMAATAVVVDDVDVKIFIDGAKFSVI